MAKGLDKQHTGIQKLKEAQKAREEAEKNYQSLLTSLENG